MSRVLLVEDDQWIADCYRLWLAADGHNVRHSRDSQTAIDMIDENPPEVIILDLLLPFSNGIQLLQTLRSHVDLASTPVILCSSALPEHLPDLSPYGVRRVLDKANLAPATMRQAVLEVAAYASV
jgi:DNA-binding response OmpR family regulator